MTTPTNSDHLRERLRQAMPIGALSSRQQAVEAIWPIIQAEINKLNAEKAETIEVLEALVQGFTWSAMGAEREWSDETVRAQFRASSRGIVLILDKLKGSPDQTKPEAGKQDWIPYGSEFPSTEALGYGFKRQAPDQTKEGS